MLHKVRQAIVVFTVMASATAITFGQAPRAQTYPGSAAQPLAVSQNESVAATVARFLGGRGKNVAPESLVVVGSPVQAANGISIIRLEQVASNLTIYGVYARASFTAQGQMVHLIENLLPRFNGVVSPAGINEAQALNAAMQRNHPDVSERPGLAQANGNAVAFQRSPFFHAQPRVTRVAVPSAGGTLRTGMLVETWSETENLLHHTLVGPAGEILGVELRTANDSYLVFKESPAAGLQTVESGPAPNTTTYSPLGWLGTGVQKTIDITGNNAHAYLDVKPNNLPDTGGTTVTGGNFLTAANLAVAPSTTDNRKVSVQNLFYLNNVIHDKLYGYGFNEGAGNFQVNNFGNGGSGNDPVNAEAQDGSGTNNANFATPGDGQSPRMQMFLWSGYGATHQAVVGANSYGANGAEFGPALTTTGIAGLLAVANDNQGASSTDGCQAITTSLTGKIAIIDRGECTFIVKVLNAQTAGAIGVIVANDLGDDFFMMGGKERRIRIPSIMVGKTAGGELKTKVNQSATIHKLAVQPVMIDSSVDSDIVYHEYGHGLTWRMIGGMSGPLAGAIGEGVGDSLAILINGDDVVGEYVTGNANGIRRDPYMDYPRTYSSITGSEVHDDGELMGAIMWEMRDLFPPAELDNLLRYFVNGMNYTPSTPAYEDMRDGMLVSDANAGGAMTA